MKQFIQSIFFFVILILLGAASLFGAVVPDNTPVRAVGGLQIAPFKNGLSLYQGNRQYYYSLSPFNDYLIDAKGIRSSFISQADIQANKFTTNLNQSHWQDIKQTIESYFGNSTLSITFKSDKEIVYNTKFSGKKVTVTRQLNVDKSLNPQYLGTTLSFDSFDFIFDKEGFLYTYQTPDDVILFSQLYGMQLVPKLDDIRTRVQSKTLVIANSNLTASLIIRAEAEQTIFVNRLERLVELEQPVKPGGNSYNTSFKVEVYENPKEAARFL